MFRNSSVAVYKADDVAKLTITHIFGVNNAEVYLSPDDCELLAKGLNAVAKAIRQEEKEEVTTKK